MESTMWEGGITPSQLRQSISLLETLDKLPGVKKENYISQETAQERFLSVDREREITSNLAFLSATSDNYLRVMAVCIEEHSNGRGITIRIASNTGDLRAVTDGFLKLAALLERAAQRKNPKSEDIDIVFKQVVTLDHRRILSRLRSKHAARTMKISGKQAIITQLHDAILYQTAKTTRMGEDIQRAKHLKDLFTRLESINDINSQTVNSQELIGEIVKHAYRFSQATDLGKALRSSQLNPNLIEHLQRAIGKLGRYYSATSGLVCAARHKTYRLFENILVEAFQIQIPASLQPTDLKVHAEIQLLFFYELHPDHPRPRFICSSKSACYLCNLFFLLHGRFCVSRTHGRLYPKWILPYWLDIPVERHAEFRRISKTLKRTIDERIQMASTSKKKKQYKFLPESELDSPAHWTSSALSKNSSARLSTSTIGPQSHFIHERGSNRTLTSHRGIPLTPPTTPPEQVFTTKSYSETKDALGNADIAESKADYEPVPNNISLITVKKNQLPYSQLVSLTTPSLHLQLDNLSITLEFLQVAVGRLLLTQVEDVLLLEKEHHIVNIEDIPTATELQLNCSSDSNELTFRLRSSRRGVICIGFLWGPQSERENHI